MSNNIEPDSLTQRTALSNSHNITILDIESRTAMSRNILVPLLKTSVLGDVMKVIPPNNDGTLHLGGGDDSLEDTATDGNVSGEGTFLVDVVSLDCSVGSFDS